MTGWDELRVALRQLRAGQPDVLQSYPSLDGDDQREPPFHVHLAPWGVAVAEDLHRRFGNQVELRVGALSFPPDVSSAVPRDFRHAALSELKSDASVQLAGPVTVRSGHTVRHGLLLTNQTEAELSIHTNGHLTAEILDLDSGQVVGGFSGFQNLPLVVFRVDTGQTIRLPLLVATASFVSALGYAVPPGRWGLSADLRLGGGRLARLPTLPIDVVP